jgi:hypothetical protein
MLEHGIRLRQLVWLAQVVLYLVAWPCGDCNHDVSAAYSLMTVWLIVQTTLLWWSMDGPSFTTIVRVGTAYLLLDLVWFIVVAVFYAELDISPNASLAVLFLLPVATPLLLVFVVMCVACGARDEVDQPNLVTVI